jgi:hypothetical protein
MDLAVEPTPGEEAAEGDEPGFTLIETPVTIGDRVVINGVLGGYLRYWGPVLFAHGLWAGVELDEPGVATRTQDFDAFHSIFMIFFC